MADIKPVRKYSTGLAEFQTGDTIGLSDGGTGADNATDARTNLGVYSTSEVDSLVSGGDLASAHEVVTGHINRDDSEFVWDTGTRTVTIQPKSPATQFQYYCANTLCTISTSASYQWPDTTGKYTLVLDDQGNLAPPSFSGSYVRNLLYDNAITVILYWNATNQQLVLQGDERHGYDMSPTTHYYLHASLGTAFGSGLHIHDLAVEGNGSSDAHAQFAVEAGSVWDEDIQHPIAEKLTTDGIKLIYRDGSDNDWVKVDNHQFLAYNGTLPSSNRAYYNEWTGTAWQLTEVTNLDYVVMHLFGSNDMDSPLIMVLGIAQYSNKNDVDANAKYEIGELYEHGLPSAEFKALGSFIMQTSGGYGNQVKSKLVSTSGGLDYFDWRYQRTGH